jgi:hypothetical protein
MLGGDGAAPGEEHDNADGGKFSKRSFHVYGVMWPTTDLGYPTLTLVATLNIPHLQGAASGPRPYVLPAVGCKLLFRARVSVPAVVRGGRQRARKYAGRPHSVRS